LKERTKEFALRVVRLYASLPRSIIAQTLGKQVLRSGTSVGAHYREAVRSRSDAEYVSKIEGALQELEETSYWLELLADAGVCQSGSLTALRAEADELTAMLVTCAKKAKSRKG
jgi:four helix bundle protein